MNRIRLALALLIGALLAFLFSVPRANAQAGPPVMVEHVIIVPDTSARNVITEYETPTIYEQWWREIAACEGLDLPIDHYRVLFFAIRAPHFYDRNHPSLYHGTDGTLYVHWAVAQSFPWELALFVSLPYVYNREVIEHEMLHFLIFWNGIPAGNDKHPMPYFGRCGITAGAESRSSTEHQRPSGCVAKWSRDRSRSFSEDSKL